MPDLSSDIAAQAVEPQAVAADGQSASARPVADLIAADQYAGAGRTAARKRRRGLMISRLTPPGAHGLNPADTGISYYPSGW